MLSAKLKRDVTHAGVLSFKIRGDTGRTDSPPIGLRLPFYSLLPPYATFKTGKVAVNTHMEGKLVLPAVCV